VFFTLGVVFFSFQPSPEATLVNPRYTETQNSKNRNGKKRDTIHPKTQISEGGPSRFFHTRLASAHFVIGFRTLVRIPLGDQICTGRSAEQESKRRSHPWLLASSSSSAQNAFQICNERPSGAIIYKRHAFCPTLKNPAGSCCRPEFTPAGSCCQPENKAGVVSN